MSGLISTLRLQPARMAAQLEPGLLATELADHLVGRGVPFREAHHHAGVAVRLAESRQIGLDRLSLSDLQGISSEFGEDVQDVLTVASALARRTAVGGTAPARLEEQLETARKQL
jgi:argininosuccinate lyase